MTGPVQPEAVDGVGRHSSAHAGRGLEYRDRHSRVGQPMSRGQPREPGADDDDIRAVRALEHVSSPRSVRPSQGLLPRPAARIRGSRVTARETVLTVRTKTVDARRASTGHGRTPVAHVIE
ncbi:hypothetical protein GCM10009680_81490 [Streptomyces yatensis]|uniref:Uncharacterized protein n=1 Tax=Streptomyces yatensis TaxID=155177 RepID=A0ABN2JI64_9ACTN